MCGLVYVKRKDGKPAYKTVLKRYRAQKERGREGFGYVAIKDNEVVSYQRSATEHEIIRLLEQETAEEILFHHRNPTSTPNIEEEAHPLLVENQQLAHQYFICHNGVIRNDQPLREGHLAQGFSYLTDMAQGYSPLTTKKFYQTGVKWNDSETLAIETAMALDGLKPTIDTEGPAAVIGIQIKGTRVIKRFFFRNTANPLQFFQDKVMTTITSRGAGAEVDSTYIFTVEPGGHAVYGGTDRRILVPRAWHTQTTKHYYGGGDSHKRNLLPVPEHESKIGFKYPSVRYAENDDDYDWPLANLDIDTEIENAIAETSVLNSTEVGVLRMSDTLLWKEHERALDLQSNTRKKIQQVEARMDIIQSDVVLEDLLDERQQAEDSLRFNEGYVELLSKEIARRESLSDRLLK